jgi:hypothetical protein
MRAATVPTFLRNPGGVRPIRAHMNKRRRGRPARGSGPVFPRDEVKGILVDGELVPHPAGPPRRVFTGPRGLARRYGVSPSTISRFARKLGIGARRAQRARTAIPWDEIDRLLVEGRLHQHQNGKLVLVFPELAELATEFDVSVPALARFVKQQRCLERRAALLTPASVTVE